MVFIFYVWFECGAKANDVCKLLAPLERKRFDEISLEIHGCSSQSFGTETLGF